MANSASSKGNPASHRMSNPKLKARRANSWANGQARKKLLTEQMKDRTADNKRIQVRQQNYAKEYGYDYPLHLGILAKAYAEKQVDLTPWQRAKVDRNVARIQKQVNYTNAHNAK